MRKIILSINPEFVNKIFDGTKKFEYRKSIPKNHHITNVIIYATAPVKKVVGEFTIQQILKSTPLEIWDLTSEYSGIDRKRFFDYFSKKGTAYALDIENVVEYSRSLSLDELGLKSPPQSWMYLR